MADKITEDMPIGEVVRKYPQTIEVFLKHGMHCIGCAAAQFENIGAGAAAHGLDIDALMKDLNKVTSKKK